jgi:hypothetical protein
MVAATAVVAVVGIMAEAIVVVVTVMATISAAGIMAAAIFTAEQRISVRSLDIGHSPDVVRFPRNEWISRAAAGR